MKFFGEFRFETDLLPFKPKLFSREREPLSKEYVEECLRSDIPFASWEVVQIKQGWVSVNVQCKGTIEVHGHQFKAKRILESLLTTAKCNSGGCVDLKRGTHAIA